MKVTSGIPLCSAICHFLFAFTTASYSLIVIKCADDTTFCFLVFDLSSHNVNILEQYDNFRWSATIQMKMNKKILSCLYCEKKRPLGIEHTVHLTYLWSYVHLRFYINSAGSWPNYIDMTIRKASSNLYGIRLLKSRLHYAHLKQLILLCWSSLSLG